MPTAILAAVITIAGWYVTYAYAKKREDRTRRIEIYEDVKRTLERLMKEHRSGLENFASS